jgi:hypothetical protein
MNTPVQPQITERRPYFIILLPVFFVLHGCLENFGFISLKDALTLTATYLVMALSIYLFSYLFFRSRIRAALIATFWMSVFFFFGAIHDFLKVHSPLKLFSRYGILLPVTFLFLIWLFIFLKKTPKRLFRFTIFLNTLLVLYILIDGMIISWKAIQHDTKDLSVYDFDSAEKFTRCDSCNKPNIYFLLFDEYAGSASLKRLYNFHNPIDSFLESKGFTIQSQSKSNYNFTVASMAAIFNMKYVNVIKDVNAVTAEDYGNCDLLIRNNSVIRFLDAQEYQIRNYSIFNLAGHPTRVEQSFLPLQTRLITQRTLFARLDKDIGWILRVYYPFRLFAKNPFVKSLKNDRLLLQLVKTESAKKEKQPRFIYAHLNMPHAPYFFDKNGRAKNDQLVMAEYNLNPPASYLEYLTYTNTQLKDLVNTIRHNDPSAAIIIMGDHGFRKPPLNNSFDHLFENLNAVYFPDKDYSVLYDSISGVNQFRVILNHMFDQSFPILHDSSIVLWDKK